MLKSPETPEKTAGPGSTMDKLTWQVLVQRTVMPFGIDIPKSQRFEGRIKSAAFLDTSLFSMVSGSHAAERTQQHIQEQKDAFCVVSFQLAGTLHLTQFGRRAKVEAGQFATYTSDAPVKIEGSKGYRSLSVKIPLTRFSSSPEELHQLSAIRYDAEQGLAPAVQSFLKHLKAGDGSIEQSTRAGISHHVVGMIEQMLHAQTTDRPFPETPADELRERCLSYIESNLQNPELTPQMIAESAFISTRYLHQLFSQTDVTVARHVRRRRLERIREDLASPRHAGDPIEQIVLRWGVQNVSYFGQVFKKVEGCTPAEFRRRALGQ